MVDEIAIQQTLNRYSEGASRRDWDQVVATFLPDGVWAVPGLGLRFEGRAALQQAMSGLVAPFDYLVQLNAPAVIELDGDRASARSVIRECAKFAGRDQAFEALAVYNDKLVRTPDGWKFVERVFQVLGKHDFPLAPQG
jgi:ketosteroid isomerase-like protein